PARHRRGPPACVLAALEPADGAGRVNTPLADAVSRAEIEDLFYQEAELLDGWKLDDWLALMTDDASYYVPPNDKPDADHRFTLSTSAAATVRLRERIIGRKAPTSPAESPPSRTRRLITNVRVTGIDGDTISASANFSIHRYRRGGAHQEFVGRYRYKLRR